MKKREKYIDNHANVSALIQECLKITGISVALDLKTVTDRVQGPNGWLLQGKRWEMRNPLLTVASAKTLLEIALEKFNFAKDVYPEEKTYAGLLLLGTTAERFLERIQFANPLIANGLPFETAYILTGTRSLEPFEYEEFPFLKELTGEETMALAMLKAYGSPALAAHIINVNAPPAPGCDRATTESTVHEWMKHSPKPGRYLGFSNGFFIPYQELVVQACLDVSYPNAGLQVECVGVGESFAPDKLTDAQLINKASIFLDTLARILYILEILTPAAP